MNINYLNKTLKRYLHEEDLKPFKFTFDLGKGRIESFIDYGIDEKDAKANLLKNTRYLQGEEENIIKVEPVKEDHEEVTLPFTMIHRFSDGPDASGEVTFFPTAFGYEYKCTENDFNGRGPQWSTIRTIEGIKIWFRNVLFEFGAKTVTIGNETWDIDDLKKNESITKIKKYNKRKIKETCMNMKNLLRTINRALNEDVESNYHIVGYIGYGSDARSELLDTADTLEEAKEIAKEIYRLYKNSEDITDNRSITILDGKYGDPVWYIDKDCEEKLNESINEEIPENHFTQDDIDYIIDNIKKVGQEFGFKEIPQEYGNKDCIGVGIKNDDGILLDATYYPSDEGFGERWCITLYDSNYEELDYCEPMKGNSYNNWTNDEIINRVKEMLEHNKYLNESSDEIFPMKEFNEELENTADNLKTMVDKIIQRYKYRTLENVSYNEEQARQIAIKIDDKLRDCYSDVYELYDLIG